MMATKIFLNHFLIVLQVVIKNLQDRENDQPYRVDVFESHLNMDIDRELGINVRNFSSRRGILPLRLRVRFTVCHNFFPTL